MGFYGYVYAPNRGIEVDFGVIGKGSWDEARSASVACQPEALC